MVNIKYDNYILKCFYNKDNNIWSNRIKYLEHGHKIIVSSYYKKHKDYIIKYYNNIKEYLQQRYNDIPSKLFSYNEVIKRIKYNIDIRPCCPVCNKPLKYIGKNKILYLSHCSDSCRSKHINIHYWRNAIKNYKFGPVQLKKRKQTCLERYGVTEYFGSDIAKQKTLESKRKNHTFNTSKQEDECYNLLCDKFSSDNIIRQYKSKLYPYNCDFYIKNNDITKRDLYIECNFHWTHHNHLYNKNNIKDFITKCKWNQRSKTSKFYDNAIEIWTKRDIIKYNTAKLNKLNYLIFYSIKEFKEWYYNL